MVTISNKHPEINIDDHEIQKVLLIFSLLTEAESDKLVMVNMVMMDTRYSYNNWSKITSTFAQQYRLIKIPDIIKSALKKLKSFIVKDKKDGTNENDSENSSRPVTSSSEGSSSS